MDKRTNRLLFIFTVFIFLLSILSYTWIEIKKRESIIFDQNIKEINSTKKVKDIIIIGKWDCLPKSITQEDGITCVKGVKTLFGNYHRLTYSKADQESATGKFEFAILRGDAEITITTPDKEMVNFFFVSKVLF